MVIERKWQVGDTLFWMPREPRRRELACEFVIEKVGRKWLTLSGGMRIYIETMTEEGKSLDRADRFYASRKAYETWVYRQQVWRRLVNQIFNNFDVLSTLSDRDLERVATIINTAIEKKEK